MSINVKKCDGSMRNIKVKGVNSSSITDKIMEEMKSNDVLYDDPKIYALLPKDYENYNFNWMQLRDVSKIINQNRANYQKFGVATRERLRKKLQSKTS